MQGKADLLLPYLNLPVGWDKGVREVGAGGRNSGNDRAGEVIHPGYSGERSRPISRFDAVIFCLFPSIPARNCLLKP